MKSKFLPDEIKNGFEWDFYLSNVIVLFHFYISQLRITDIPGSIMLDYFGRTDMHDFSRLISMVGIT